jgi:hypothetical protein
MVKPRGFLILVARASAATGLVSFVSVPDEHLMALVSGGLQLKFLSLWTLGTIPLAFAIPRLRASFFVGASHFPSDTYAFPRWTVLFVIGGVIGQVAGLFVLAVVRDHRLFWLAGSATLVGAAFCAGARGRLKKHPNTEFTMPWWR